MDFFINAFIEISFSDQKHYFVLTGSTASFLR